MYQPGPQLLLRHMPGKHDQATHGHGHAGVTGQAALDAAPAKLTPAPGGHGGNYEGEQLDGPADMGSVRALSEYEGVEYSATNGFLRGQFREGYAPQGVHERIAEIDKTMAVSKLDKDVQVQRGVKDGSKVFGDAWHGHVIDWKGSHDEIDAGYERWNAGERPNLTGLKFRDKGFVSTTANPAIAEQHVRFQKQFFQQGEAQSQGEPVIMNIHVPKGIGAIQLSGMDREAELLLERGLTLQVVADHGIRDGLRQLDVEVIAG